MKSNAGVKIELKSEKIYDKLHNDNFGLFLAIEWKRLIDPYTPRRNGQLTQLVSYAPFEITYRSPYSHYMYNGIVYIDPVYKVGGFTNNGGETWFSRPGIAKIPSGRRFNYLRDMNPYAADHWDKAAEKAGQKEKLISAANKYLTCRRY